MAHSLLLQEGTGISMARREEIVFEAHAAYVDTFPEYGLENYGFTNTANFDNASLDFDARLLPEKYADIDAYDSYFQSFTNLDDRFRFLRGVASAIVLEQVEVDICAELLGVRSVLLQAATQPKPTRIRQLPRFLAIVPPLAS